MQIKVIITTIVLTLRMNIVFAEESKLFEIPKLDSKFSMVYNIESGYKYVTSIKIHQGKKTYSFKVENFKGVGQNHSFPFKLTDLNQDGHLDISLLIEANVSNVQYYYLLYSKAKKAFVELGYYDLLAPTGKDTLEERGTGTIYQIKKDQLEPIGQER